MAMRSFPPSPSWGGKPAPGGSRRIDGPSQPKETQKKCKKGTKKFHEQTSKCTASHSQSKAHRTGHRHTAEAAAGRQRFLGSEAEESRRSEGGPTLSYFPVLTIICEGITVQHNPTDGPWEKKKHKHGLKKQKSLLKCLQQP